MENKTKINTKEFHAVDFMLEVHSELTQQFLHDKQKYFDYLKQVLEDFKLRQKKNKI